MEDVIPAHEDLGDVVGGRLRSQSLRRGRFRSVMDAAVCCCCRQVMKESRGRANPAELNRLLMETLNAGQA